MVVYSQLRVSCGLSAIINSLQPQDLKISPSETLGHWLDANWLRLTNNNDPSNPLVNLCIAREHKWVAVLDYILLRKIRSSLLLCKGISPGSLSQADVGEEHIDWDKLKPVVIKIIQRLNQMKNDWPLWGYKAEYENIEKEIEEKRVKRETLSLIQSIKVFYEIWESNITTGPDADWKLAVSLPKFPEEVTPLAVAQHLDHFKTNHELTALLNTLGWLPEPLPSSKNYRPNSIVLVNRPQHWVCEDTKNKGVILDSLTVGTDTPRMGDTPYYYIPVSNLHLMKKNIQDLTQIFPDIEIDIEDEGLTDFPPLGPIPITNDPITTSEEFDQNARAKYLQGEYKEALLDKRMACAILDNAKVEEAKPKYLDCLLDFTDWCMKHDKMQTATENVEKIIQLEKTIPAENIFTLLKSRIILAHFYSFNEDVQKASKELHIALELCEDHPECIQEGFEIANGLGVLHAKNNEYQDAIDSFKHAREFAEEIYKNVKDEVAENLQGPPKKYWPAIIQGLYNKVLELEKFQVAAVNAVSKVE